MINDMQLIKLNNTLFLRQMLANQFLTMGYFGDTNVHVTRCVIHSTAYVAAYT
jgi:hypothetical protein